MPEPLLLFVWLPTFGEDPFWGVSTISELLICVLCKNISFLVWSRYFLILYYHLMLFSIKVPFFISCVIVLKLAKKKKKIHFLQICADLSKKSRSIKAICISIWKTSSCSFKKVCFIGVWETVQQILRNKISKPGKFQHVFYCVKPN